MYRYKLEPYKGMATKHHCPQCEHKKVFTKYIDTQNQVILPDYVGRCDREDKCGYHFTPKEYFKQNPHLSEIVEQYAPTYQKIQPTEPPKPTSYISSEFVGRTLLRHQGHHLFTFLASQIGKDAADKLMGKYRVTSSTHWSGATLFWQMDFNDRARTGKIMLYNPTTGRRVKEPNNYIQWAHRLIGDSDYNLKQCFFGEHLLQKEVSKTVAIVESEKSALVAAHYLPSFTWIATGGKNGCLREENIDVLKGRKVVLFPDLGATEAWRTKLSIFKAHGIEVELFDGLENLATDEQRQQGLDIADFSSRRKFTTRYTSKDDNNESCIANANR